MATLQTVRRTTMLLVTTLLMASAVAGIQIATAQPAYAACADNPLIGKWHNIDPATRSATRVDIRYHCGDTVQCDQDGNCTGGNSFFIINPYFKCDPTECDLGVRYAESMADGWERVIYDLGFGAIHIWVKTYVFDGTTYLRVWVYTDYRPPDDRADQTTDEWMVK